MPRVLSYGVNASKPVALCPASVWKELVLVWSRKLALIIFLSPCWGNEISHYKRGIVNSSRSWTCYPCGHLILLVQPSFFPGFLGSLQTVRPWKTVLLVPPLLPVELHCSQWTVFHWLETVFAPDTYMYGVLWTSPLGVSSSQDLLPGRQLS